MRSIQWIEDQSQPTSEEKGHFFSQIEFILSKLPQFRRHPIFQEGACNEDLRIFSAKYSSGSAVFETDWHFHHLPDETIHLSIKLTDPEQKYNSMQTIPETEIKDLTGRMLSAFNSRRKGVFSCQSVLLQYAKILHPLILLQRNKLQNYIQVINNLIKQDYYQWLSALKLIPGKKDTKRTPSSLFIAEFGEMTNVLRFVYEYTKSLKISIFQDDPPRKKTTSIAIVRRLKQVEKIMDNVKMILLLKGEKSQLIDRSKLLRPSVGEDKKEALRLFKERRQACMKARQSWSQECERGIVKGLTINPRTFKTGEAIAEGTYNKVDEVMFSYRMQVTINAQENQSSTELNEQDLKNGIFARKLIKTQQERDDYNKRKQICSRYKKELTLAKPQSQDTYEQNVDKKLFSDDELISFQNQKSALEYLRNQKCPYIASHFSKNKTIFMEKLPSTLYAQMHALRMEDRFKICLQIISTIGFFWSKKMLHRDLKETNIMLDEKRQAKVIDFGSCCGMAGNKAGDFNVPENRLCSTPGYYVSGWKMVESFRKDYTQQQFDRSPFFDIYSFGQILSNMFDLKYVIQDDLLMHPIGETIQDLIYLQKSCKEKNPDDRLDCYQVQVYLREIYNQWMRSVLIN